MKITTLLILALIVFCLFMIVFIKLTTPDMEVLIKEIPKQIIENGRK